MIRMILSAGLLLSGLFATTASAITLDGSDIAAGNTGPLTFTANGGDFTTKSRGGVTGVGVSGGRTNGEIDIDESITATGNFVLNSASLMLLFDGGEFNDVQERARLKATLAGGGTSTATITNVYTSPMDLNVELMGGAPSATIMGVTPAVSGGTARVTLNNPFGDAFLTSLEFTAVAGTTGIGSGTNQSDYAISSVVATPAPATLGLMGIGVAMIGGIAGVRRRTAL